MKGGVIMGQIAGVLSFVENENSKTFSDVSSSTCDGSTCEGGHCQYEG